MVTREERRENRKHVLEALRAETGSIGGSAAGERVQAYCADPVDAAPVEVIGGTLDSQLQAITAEGLLLQPALSVYAENSGYYRLAGDDAVTGSVKNLSTLTIDYWPLPDRQDVLLRPRYENGEERASPDEYRNRLLVSAVLRL